MSPIQDIAFVRYQVTDLDAQESFLQDFGLHIVARLPHAIYARTAGPAHHNYVAEAGPENATIGFGLLARSLDDLARVAARVGQPVTANHEPGGGQRVRFVDPAGFVVDVIHGRAEHEPMPMREPIPFNPSTERRRLGRPVRLAPAPCTLARLGHVALLVKDFRSAFEFYREVLGFEPSDTYWAGSEGNTIAAFMHCGLGEQWTDHHTVALITSRDGVSRFDHSAFEALDFDDLVQGGRFLESRGWKRSWGVGRHVQGSQIFDYWRDPHGNKIEHWTDGDMVNERTPVGTAPIGPDTLSQWAPPLTPDFLT